MTLRLFCLFAGLAILPVQAADNQNSLLMRAEAAASTGDHITAAELFQQAASATPESGTIRFRLASQLAFAGRTREAGDIFRSLAASADPTLAAMARTSLAALEKDAKRREEFLAREKAYRARERAARALQASRENAFRQKEASLAARQAIYDRFAEGDDAGGLALLQAYAAREPVPPELLYAEVYALQKLGRNAEAESQLGAMPKHLRTTPEWHLALGRLQARIEPTEAWKSFSEAEQLAAGTPLAEEALREQRALPGYADPNRHAWGELRLDAQYMTRFDDTIFYGELREGLYVPGARWLQPFVQLDFTLDTRSQAQSGLSQVYANNLAGLHAGVRLQPFLRESFWIYAMVGPQKDLRDTTRYEGGWFLDFRAGVRGFKGVGPGLDFLPEPAGSTASRWRVVPRLAWLAEAGGDASYYSLYENFIAYGQAREGFRVAEIGRWLGVDAYALQQGSVDALGLYYNNFMEIGGGVRTIARLGRGTSLVTRFEYLGGFYLGVANDNSRGSLPASYDDFRVTVSLWAEW